MAKQRVYQVVQVNAWIDGNVLHVIADGTTRTGGWTDPELEPGARSGDVQPFAFVATPPSGPSIDQITPIRAQYVSGPLLPPFPRVVVVAAETKEVKAEIGSTPYAPPPSGSGPYATA